MPAPAKALTVQETLVANVGDRIFFDFESAALRQDAIETIGRQAEYLKSEPDIKVMIEGHTAANEGHAYPHLREKYNLDLGCRRARVLREALIERGIAPDRLGAISYGAQRPAVLGDNEAAWQQNRRAVFIQRIGNTGEPFPLNCSGE